MSVNQTILLPLLGYPQWLEAFPLCACCTELGETFNGHIQDNQPWGENSIMVCVTANWSEISEVQGGSCNIRLLLYYQKCFWDAFQSFIPNFCEVLITSEATAGSFFPAVDSAKLWGLCPTPTGELFCLRQLQDSLRRQRKQRGLWTSRWNHAEDVRATFEQTPYGSKIRIFPECIWG